MATVPGWAGPIRLYPDEKHITVLCGQNAIRFLSVEDGSVVQSLKKSDGQPDRAWKDFAIGARGEMCISTVNKRQISVEVLKADGKEKPNQDQ